MKTLQFVLGLGVSIAMGACCSMSSCCRTPAKRGPDQICNVRDSGRVSCITTREFLNAFPSPARIHVKRHVDGLSIPTSSGEPIIAIQCGSSFIGLLPMGNAPSPDAFAKLQCEKHIDEKLQQWSAWSGPELPQPGQPPPAPSSGPPSSYQALVTAVKQHVDAEMASCSKPGPGSTVAEGGIAVTIGIATGLAANLLYELLNEGALYVIERLAPEPAGNDSSPIHTESIQDLGSFSPGGHTSYATKISNVYDRSFEVTPHGTFKIEVTTVKTTVTTTTYDPKTSQVTHQTQQTTIDQTIKKTNPDGSTVVTTTHTDADGKQTSRTETYDAMGRLTHTSTKPETQQKTPQPAPDASGTCLDEALCTTSCQRARGWWTLFKASCDAARWETYQCKSFVRAHYPLCPNLAIAMPNPDGDYRCGARATAEELRRAAVAACRKRAGVMLQVEGQEVCRLHDEPHSPSLGRPDLCSDPRAVRLQGMCVIDIPIPIQGGDIPWNPVPQPKPVDPMAPFVHPWNKPMPRKPAPGPLSPAPP